MQKKNLEVVAILLIYLISKYLKATFFSQKKIAPKNSSLIVVSDMC